MLILLFKWSQHGNLEDLLLDSPCHLLPSPSFQCRDYQNVSSELMKWWHKQKQRLQLKNNLQRLKGNSNIRWNASLQIISQGKPWYMLYLTGGWESDYPLFFRPFGCKHCCWDVGSLWTPGECGKLGFLPSCHSISSIQEHRARQDRCRNLFFQLERGPRWNHSS